MLKQNVIALTYNSKIKGYVVIENNDNNFRIFQRNVNVIGNIVLRAIRDGTPVQEMYDKVKQRIKIAKVFDVDYCFDNDDEDHEFEFECDENAVDAKIDVWNGKVEMTYKAPLEWYLNTSANKLPEEKAIERARELAMERKLKEKCEQ